MLCCKRYSESVGLRCTCIPAKWQTNNIIPTCSLKIVCLKCINYIKHVEPCKQEQCTVHYMI